MALVDLVQEERYEDGSRQVHRYIRRIRGKTETHVKLFDTCNAQGGDT